MMRILHGHRHPWSVYARALPTPWLLSVLKILQTEKENEHWRPSDERHAKDIYGQANVCTFLSICSNFTFTLRAIFPTSSMSFSMRPFIAEDELFQMSVQFRNADISLCVNKWSCTCTFHCRSLSDWLRFLISFLYICRKYKVSLHGSKSNTTRKWRKNMLSRRTNISELNYKNWVIVTWSLWTMLDILSNSVSISLT